VNPDALFDNTINNYLLAVGGSALFSNGLGGVINVGYTNTALGSKALMDNTVGTRNTTTGPDFINPDNTTAIGYLAAITTHEKVVKGNSNVLTIGGYSGWAHSPMNDSIIKLKRTCPDWNY